MFLLVFLFNSSRLLLTLLVLEIMSFFIILVLALRFSSLVSIEFLLISFFCLFVIEGVIAVSGLIILVRFSGSDYIRSSSALKF
jgi:hypothetical protein